MIAEYLSSLTLWNYVESLTFIANLIYVYLIARENALGWAFGVLGSSLLALYSWYTGLWFQTWLNLFYVATGLWGWWQWKYGGSNEAELPITFGGVKNNIAVIVLSLMVSGLLIWRLQTPEYTGYLMYLEITCSVFAVPITLMTTRKWIENWIYWVFIDIGTIVLYWSQSSFQIASLYAVYIIVSIIGLYDWYPKMKSERTNL